MQTLEYDLRELAANLMRIAAGAGTPKRLRDQLADVLSGLIDLEQIGAALSNAETQQMLSYERQYEGEFPPDELAWVDGMRMMTRAGLRIAAADMLGQLSQRSGAEGQFFEGFQIIEAVRERNRRRPGGTSRR
jgi:hypothetical protein